MAQSVASRQPASGRGSGNGRVSSEWVGAFCAGPFRWLGLSAVHLLVFDLLLLFGQQ
jgi:hypothetical protein